MVRVTLRYSMTRVTVHNYKNCFMSLTNFSCFSDSIERYKFSITQFTIEIQTQTISSAHRVSNTKTDQFLWVCIAILKMTLFNLKSLQNTNYLNNVTVHNYKNCFMTWTVSVDFQIQSIVTNLKGEMPNHMVC